MDRRHPAGTVETDPRFSQIPGVHCERGLSGPMALPPSAPPGTSGEVGDRPRQDEEPRVVDDDGEVLLAQLRRPPDESVARRQPLRVWRSQVWRPANRHSNPARYLVQAGSSVSSTGSKSPTPCTFGLVLYYETMVPWRQNRQCLELVPLDRLALERDGSASWSAARRPLSPVVPQVRRRRTPVLEVTVGLSTGVISCRRI